MKYYDKKNNRLVFVKRSATPDFWDEQWNVANFRKAIEAGRHERFVSRTTTRYIFAGKGKRILEGGCGKGNFVYSLSCRGYDAYGVDFAEKTVARINSAMPELNVIVADVRKLPFENNYFDGYWSLGVIEHFYEGYNKIAEEMARVIKPGGYLFLTFPYMSPLRRLKAKFESYPPLSHQETEPDGFYQFALDSTQTRKYFERLGFECVQEKPFEGFKGLKEEVAPSAKKFLQKIYDCKYFLCRIIDFMLSTILAPVCGHTILLVLRKKL